MIETRRFAYFDTAGDWHDVLQTWAMIPGTGVCFLVAVHPLEVDPSTVPPRPTRAI